MKMTADEFDQRVAQYVKSVMIPECKSGLRKFVLGAAVGSGRLSVRLVPDEALKALGVVDGDGNVDVDVVKKAAVSGMDSAGEVAVLGLHFTKTDVDRLFNFVEKGVLG